MPQPSDNLTAGRRSSTCVASTSTYPFHVQRPLAWNGATLSRPIIPPGSCDLPIYHRPHPSFLLLENLLAVDGERASDNRARETSDGARRDRERGTKTEREGERATLARFLSYLFGVVLGCAARRTSGKMAAGSEPRCRCSRPLLPQQRRARTGGAGGRGQAAAAEQEEEEAEE